MLDKIEVKFLEAVRLGAEEENKGSRGIQDEPQSRDYVDWQPASRRAR
jgi:hypothetical protein